MEGRNGVKNEFLQKIIQERPNGKGAEYLGTIIEKTGLISALDRSSKDYNSERGKLWRAASVLYWSAVEEIIRDKFVTPGEAPEALEFSPEEASFINFGFFSEDFCPNPGTFGDVPPSAFTIQTMTDWIEENFCLYFNRDCRFARERLRRAEQDMEVRRNTVISKLKIMVPLILSSGEGASVSKREAEELVGEWASFLPSYSYVAAKTAEWRTENEEDRKRIAFQARRFMELTEKIDMLLKGREGSGDREAILRLKNFLYECRNMVVFKAYMSKESDKLRQKQERMASKYADDFTGAKTSFLDLIGQKKEYASLMAKQIRREYSPLLDNDGHKELLSLKDVQNSVFSVLFADPGLLSVARVRMYGMPRILIVPGRGVGAYDWSDNTLLLPVSPSRKDAERALSFACASFRWDTDEERLLKDTYDKLKENKGKNIIDMAVSFSKDYFLWVTKESKGYRILPRENHKWFTQHFSPKIDVF